MQTQSKTIPKSSSRSWTRLAVIGLGIIALVCVVAYFALGAYIADQFSRPERYALTQTPAAYGMKYENVAFESAVDHIPLRGWYIDSPGDKVILQLHGRNGTRDAGSGLAVAQMFVQNNYDVLMFDFRGHGESGGERYSIGLLEVRDVAGALNYLKTRGVQDVGVIGFSMGAATTLNAAPDLPAMRAVVADSAFADINLLLDEQLPQETGLPAWVNPGVLLMGKLLYGIDLAANRPVSAIARLTDRPVFLIHGTKDDLVPVHHAELLAQADAANPNLSVWILDGVGHTDAFDEANAEYRARVLDFFARNLQ